MTIAWDEMDGSPDEGADRDGFTATRKIMCAYADRHLLSAELLTMPGQLYPYKSCLARATKVGIVGMGQFQWTGTAPTYEKAVLTVQYSTPKWGHPEQRGGSGSDYISESLEPTAEFMTTDWHGLTWGSGGPALVAEEAPGRLIRGLDYVYKRHHVMVVPSAALTLVGLVNLAAQGTATLGLTFAAQTLLFQPPLIDRVVDTLGVSKLTLTYRFTFRSSGGHGWNWYWHKDTQTYKQMYKGTTPYLQYETGDFSAL